MERSADRFDRPVEDSGAACRGGLDGWSETLGDSEGLPAWLFLLLLGELAAFAALTASGNIPQIVSVLYRALLTL